MTAASRAVRLKSPQIRVNRLRQYPCSPRAHLPADLVSAGSVLWALRLVRRVREQLVEWHPQDSGELAQYG